MNYTEYKVWIKPIDPWFDVLVSMLEPYVEGFQQEKDHLLFYTQEENHKSEIKSAFEEIRSSADFFDTQESFLQSKNWNEEWESAYDPVIIEGQCAILAPFHADDYQLPYKLVIQPQMSFGTGHHQTTYLMAKALLGRGCKNEEVLDMGCGTGVLGILAHKLQAKMVFGVDVEDNAVENAKENVALNSAEMEVALGSKEQIEGKLFDLILANINKNILKDQMTTYFQSLKNEGELLISGFMNEDKNELIEFAKKIGFSYINYSEKENWICVHLRK